VKAGDRVLFSPDDPYEVEIAGETFLVLRERDLHAVGKAGHGAQTGMYL
jgi:chaperonin GroES